MLEMFRPGCRKVRRELWDYAGDRLCEGPMEQVERHLDQCSACRQEVKVMRESQRLLATCREETPPSRAGWSDLRSRLASEGVAETRQTAYASGRRVSQMSDLGEFRQPSRNNWLPRLSMASGFAALLMVCALSYRISLPQAEKTKSTPEAPLAFNGGTSLLGLGGATDSMRMEVGGPSEATRFTQGVGETTPANTHPNDTRPAVKVASAPPKDADKREVRIVPVDIEKEQAAKPHPKNAKPNSMEFGTWKLVLNNGKPHYQETKAVASETKKSSIPETPKRDSTPSNESANRYDVAGNGYVMGSLTPASYEDEVY